MDPIAHTLSGIALANAGVKQRIGTGALLALILASNIVDVDIFGLFFMDEPSWMYRRMWTHSLFMAPLLALSAAAVFRFCFPQAGYRAWLGVFALGISLHVFMDLINSYGVVLFFPLSRARFELAWVFIIDIYIWSILLIGLIAPLVAKRFKKELSIKKSAQAALVLLLLYMSSCGLLRMQAHSLLKALAAEQYPRSNFSYVFPEPFGPWRFHGVLRQHDSYYSFLIHPLSKTLALKRSYKTDDQDPAVAALIESESGQHYQWFFKAPLWEKKDRDKAVVSDIRFKNLLLKERGAFQYVVTDK